LGARIEDLDVEAAALSAGGVRRLAIVRRLQKPDVLLLDGHHHLDLLNRVARKGLLESSSHA